MSADIERRRELARRLCEACLEPQGRHAGEHDTSPVAGLAPWHVAAVARAWHATIGVDALGYWPLDIAEQLAGLMTAAQLADALVGLLVAHYGDGVKDD